MSDDYPFKIHATPFEDLKAVESAFSTDLPMGSSLSFLPWISEIPNGVVDNAVEALTYFVVCLGLGSKERFVWADSFQIP